MSEKKTVTPNSDPDTRMLRDDELETVSGGHASTPLLYKHCCQGQHIREVTLSV